MHTEVADPGTSPVPSLRSGKAGMSPMEERGTIITFFRLLTLKTSGYFIILGQEIGR